MRVNKPEKLETIFDQKRTDYMGADRTWKMTHRQASPQACEPFRLRVDMENNNIYVFTPSRVMPIQTAEQYCGMASQQVEQVIITI